MATPPRTKYLGNQGLIWQPAPALCHECRRHNTNWHRRHQATCLTCFITQVSPRTLTQNKPLHRGLPK